MAPEQARGLPADHRSDLFSFGAVLWEMVAGRRVFSGASAAEVLASVLRDEPPALASTGGLADALLEVAGHCLEKDPAPEIPVGARSRLRPSRGGVGRVAARRDAAAGARDRERPVGRRPPVPEPEPGEGQRVPERRAERGDHPRAHEGRGASRRGPYVLVRVQGQGRGRARDRRAPRSALRPRGQRPAGGRAAARDGAAHRRDERVPALVGAVRPDARRRLRRAGRDRARDRRDAPRPALRRGLGAARGRAADPAAYDLYLRGRFFFNRRSAPKAIEAFEAALARDPAFAAAYTGLADAWGIHGYYGGIDTRVAFARARAAVEQARALAPDAPEVAVSFAIQEHYFGWDFAREERELDAARDAAPRLAAPYYWLGLIFGLQGRTEDALPLLERVAELEPLNPLSSTAFGWVFFTARRFEEARDSFARALEIDPHAILPLQGLGRSLLMLGDAKAALEPFERLVSVAGRTSTYAVGAWAEGLAAAGRTAEARAALAALTASGVYVPATHVVNAELRLGDREAALASLARAVDERNALAWWWVRHEPGARAPARGPALSGDRGRRDAGALTASCRRPLHSGRVRSRYPGLPALADARPRGSRPPDGGGGRPLRAPPLQVALEGRRQRRDSPHEARRGAARARHRRALVGRPVHPEAEADGDRPARHDGALGAPDPHGGRGPRQREEGSPLRVSRHAHRARPQGPGGRRGAEGARREAGGAGHDRAQLQLRGARARSLRHGGPRRRLRRAALRRLAARSRRARREAPPRAVPQDGRGGRRVVSRDLSRRPRR